MYLVDFYNGYNSYENVCNTRRIAQFSFYSVKYIIHVIRVAWKKKKEEIFRFELFRTDIKQNVNGYKLSKNGVYC